MGELKIKLPDELEMAFRQIAMRRYGYMKGAISEAVKIAIENWNEEYAPIEIETSWDSLVGIMAHVKKTSVELQHEAWNSVIEKHSKKYKRKK